MSSQFTFPPPTIISSSFNPAFFSSPIQDTLYVLSSDPRIGYLSTNPGTVIASKSLISDSGNNLAGLHRLNLTNTYSGAGYNGINASNFALNIRSSVDGNGVFCSSGIAFNNGTTSATNALAGIILDRTSSTSGDLVMLANNGGTLYESARFVATGLKIDQIAGNSGSNVLIYTGNRLSIGSNGSTGDSQLNLLDGTSGTTPVSMRFGNALSANNCMTMTWNPTGGAGSANNYLQFNPYGTSNALTVGCDGRVAVGSAPATAGFFCNVSVSQTIDSGGSGVAYFLKTGGLITTIGPLSSISVGVRSVGAILAAAGVYTTSDRRIKKDIVDMDSTLDILKVNPVLYRYKTQDDSVPLQCGYIAQDLIKAGLPHVINFSEHEGLEVEDESIDIKDMQFSVDYSKICVLLHLALKSQKNLIDHLIDRVEKLEKVKN